MIDFETTRRTMLGLSAATVAASALATPSVPMGPGRGVTGPRYLDPIWNREQSAKLQAHIDGRQVYGRCSGTISGVRPGEAVRTLFGFEVFSAIRVVRRPDGNFDRMCKEVVFYTDPQTGEILDHWDNPYTHERVRVVDIANDPYNWVIRDWVGPAPVPGLDTHNLPMPPASERKPFLLHWTDFSPDTIIVHEGGNAYYPNLLNPAKWPRESAGKFVQATELFRYFIRKSDLDNPRLTRLPHNGVWIRITPWLPWMLMGMTTGHIMYEGEFTGADSTEYHDPRVIARVRARYPQFLEAPTKWYGPSLSSIEHYAREQKPAPLLK